LVLAIFVGSVASGKTSTARVLKKILTDRGFTAKYVDININHGFAYLLTRIIVSLLKLDIQGNYYLTIRFNNENFFRKYLRFMQFLDAFYIPIKYLVSLKTFMLFNKFRKRRYVILLDEYYLNSIVDHLYFATKLCGPCSSIEWCTRFFYNLAFRVVLTSIKMDKTMIIHMGRNFDESVKGWVLREKTRLVDVNHIAFRNCATRIMLNILKQYVGDNVSFKSHTVQNFTETSKNITKDVLEFVS
jgi:hypothetical protein